MESISRSSASGRAGLGAAAPRCMQPSIVVHVRVAEMCRAMASLTLPEADATALLAGFDEVGVAAVNRVQSGYLDKVK